jgi:Calponin homology (CH) domain
LNFLSGIKKETKDLRNISAVTKSSESSLHGLPPRNPTMSPNIQKKFVPETPQKPPEQSAYEAKPVPESLKETLISWLEDLNILRRGTVNTQLLPSICRTGVLFCDLINRLEGKSEPVKGIERNPRNRTQALANMSKALDHLRNLPKMNSRYLWSGKNIIEGDEFIVWGLLDDVKSLYTVKVKPTSLSSISRPPSNNSVPSIRASDEISLPKSFLEEKSKSLRSYSASMRRTPSQTPSLISPRLSRPSSSKSVKAGTSKSHFYISQEMKKAVMEWIDALGIEYEENSNPYIDTLRNGTLVCELIRILESETIKINPNPRSLKAVTENFERALGIFKKKHPDVPSTALSQSESLAKNAEIVFGFVYSLMSIYPTSVPYEYLEHPLPYGAVGIRRLEVSITNWIISLNILQPSPTCFQELISELKSGVLLCVILSRLFSVKISNITRDPKTEQSAMNNIRKALDILRKIPQMSQKFIWSGKEISKGSYGVLLGLLEDIHRCADGLPVRKSGEDYHKDGPYLGKKDIHRTPTWKNCPEESFNTTFGSANSPKTKSDDQIDCYTEWLYEIGASFPRSISFMEEHIPEFTTGILICNIASVLEKINIPGIDKEPKTRANAIQNISKALNILKKKNTFPNDLKNCEEDIFLGNGGVIRKLMQALMKIYKGKNRQN